MKKSSYLKTYFSRRVASYVAAPLSIMCFSCNAIADSDKKIVVSIPEQTTNSALLKFAEDTNIQVVLPKGIGSTSVSPALSGSFTLDEILGKLLADTGLVYEISSDSLVLIREEGTGAATGRDRDGNAKIKDKQNQRYEVEEVVVTATKRETSLQDTAMSISAFGGDAIEKRGLVSMDDYLRTVPGVSFQDRGAGSNTVVMRGIAVSPQTEDSSVGVYFGETSVTGLSSYHSGNADLKMVDIDRVEVLRGPQGTLYGAGSMGGTVRVIPKAPDLEQMEGKVAAEYSSTGNLGGNGTMVQGMINLPLVQDQFAVRAVGYRFDNSGYIDNIAASYTGNANNEIAKSYGAVATDRGDIGSSDYTGFRLSALWRPSDRLDIALGHTRQEIEQLGVPKVGLELQGEYLQTDLNTGQHGSKYPGMSSEINLTTLQIDYDLTWGNLVGISSWVESEGEFNFDLSYIWGIPVENKMPRDFSVFTQEIRFSSQFQGPIQVLAGVYYEDREETIDYQINYTGDLARESDMIADFAAFFPTPADASPGFMWDSLSYFWLPTFSVEQKAVFGELTYDITDQLAITAGGRYFEYDRGETSIEGGSFFIGDLSTEIDSALDAQESGTNFKVNVSWKPGDDTLLYAQWAEGFRLGRPQAPPPGSICDVDNDGLLETADGGEIPVKNVDSDNLENYELGYKTSFADNRISFNAALYRINWEGIPVTVSLACTYSRIVNAGKATSEGIELESRVRLTDQLHLNLGLSYNDATLAADTLSLGASAVKGAKLPGSSDFTFSSGLEYQFSLAGYDAFAQVDYAYVSEYYNNLGEIGDAAGGFHQVHLKSGVTAGNVSASVFVKNLTNADNFTWINPYESAGYRLRPRTIGLNFSYHF